jgi:hypothetical protein
MGTPAKGKRQKATALLLQRIDRAMDCRKTLLRCWRLMELFVHRLRGGLHWSAHHRLIRIAADEASSPPVH